MDFPKCFFCERLKDEQAIKALKVSGINPVGVVMDYDPCPTCAAKLGDSILIMEATPYRNWPGQVPHDGTFFPTGRYAALPEDTVRKIPNPALVEHLLEVRRTYMLPDEYKQILPWRA